MRGVLTRYGIAGRAPFFHDDFIETPREDRWFDQVTNLIMANNQMALAA